MKRNFILWLFLAALPLALWNCEKEDNKGSLPTDIVIDIPDAISFEGETKSAHEGDTTLSGDKLYEHLRNFIKIGEESAELVQEIMKALAKNNINSPREFEFTGDDERVKTATVTVDDTYEDVLYDFKLIIKDGNNFAMLICWNTESVNGVAVLKPFNMNEKTPQIFKNVLYKIEYNTFDTTEFDNAEYEKTMVVSITGWPMLLGEVFGIDNLKMFVGKKGNVVDIFGNSNHPTTDIFHGEGKGLSWCFAGRGDQESNIGVAKVALTPMGLTTTDGIFNNYSIKMVLGAFLHSKLDPLVWSGVAQEQIDLLINTALSTAQSPAYFNDGGFVSCGGNIPEMEGFTTEFIDISGLTAYPPVTIKELEIAFEE